MGTLWAVSKSSWNCTEGLQTQGLYQAQQSMVLAFLNGYACSLNAPKPIICQSNAASAGGAVAPLLFATCLFQLTRAGAYTARCWHAHSQPPSPACWRFKDLRTVLAWLKSPFLFRLFSPPGLSACSAVKKLLWEGVPENTPMRRTGQS